MQDLKPDFRSTEEYMEWGFAELEKNEEFQLERDLFVGGAGVDDE